jgi:hypothetical protein
MARIILATLCDDIREEKTKFSLMGIFNQFNVVDFRAPLPPFCIFATIGFDTPGTHAVSIELRRVEGDRIFRAEQNHAVEVQDPATMQYHALVNLKLANLTFPGPGRYELAFECDGQHTGTVYVNVVQPPPRLVQ